MYFDLWDNRPDTPRLSSPLTPREKGMAALVVHLLVIILILAWPELPWVKEAEARRLKELEQQQLVDSSRIHASCLERGERKSATERAELWTRSPRIRKGRAVEPRTTCVRARKHHGK